MFQFHPFEEKHLPLLRQWLRADHIRDFWQESDDDQELRSKFLIELPRRGVVPLIISRDHHSLGYIQYYDASKVGGGWWEDEAPGTFGLDLMIGAVEFLGKGHGARIVRDFVAFVQAREPSLRGVIIDPDPRNLRAIRAFEKAGFRRESEIQTPGGAALLMRMTFPD